MILTLIQIHTQGGFIKQIIKQLVDLQFLTLRKSETCQPDNLVALIITSQNTELNLLPIWFWIIGKVSSLKTVANCLLIWPLFLQGVSLNVQGQTIAISTFLIDTIQGLCIMFGMKVWFNWISRSNSSERINTVRATNIIKEVCKVWAYGTTIGHFLNHFGFW